MHHVIYPRTLIFHSPLQNCVHLTLQISSGSIETTETSHNLPGVILVTSDLRSHLSVDGDVLGVTGYTAEEFVALDPRRDFLSPKADRVKLASIGVAMMDPTQAFVEVDIPYIHKDGHTIWLRACQGSRMVGTTANGRPKVMAVFSDVTAKVQREVLVLSVSLAWYPPPTLSTRLHKRTSHVACMPEFS